jgi:hypothetical protein
MNDEITLKTGFFLQHIRWQFYWQDSEVSRLYSIRGSNFKNLEPDSKSVALNLKNHASDKQATLLR